jgi:large subunit ribosomal protein L18
MKFTSQDLRKRRVRARIKSEVPRLRLSVFASLSHIHAQVIDDANGKTIAAASDLKIIEKLTKTEKASKVGEMIAEAAKKAKVSKVVFDRGSKLYHGRVKALAEAARNNGLEF